MLKKVFWPFLLLIGLISGIVIATSVIESVPTQFEVALKECGISPERKQVSLDRDGKGLFLDGHGDLEPGMPLKDSACVLKRLKLPKSVTAKIDNSFGSPFEREAIWDNIKVSWTYDADLGLDLYLEILN